MQLARGFKLESLAKLKSTKSFNRRTTALHFLVANIEKSMLPPPEKQKEEKEGGTPGAATAMAPASPLQQSAGRVEGLFGIMKELPTLQAAKRLVYNDSLALVDEMRRGLKVLEAEMAKMEEGASSSKLEEFVDYVKTSIVEVDQTSQTLCRLMQEAGTLFGQDVSSQESVAKEPAYMFNLIYDFLENLSSARLERNQVDACHKITAA